VPVGPVGTQERAQVQLVHDVEDEPGQVVGRQPVAQVRGEQERLVAVAGKEVVGHGRSYATSQLADLFRQTDQTRRQPAKQPRGRPRAPPTCGR
jgi:hypothetical protein